MTFALSRAALIKSLSVIDPPWHVRLFHYSNYCSPIMNKKALGCVPTACLPYPVVFHGGTHPLIYLFPWGPMSGGGYPPPDTLSPSGLTHSQTYPPLRHIQTGHTYSWKGLVLEISTPLYPPMDKHILKTLLPATSLVVGNNDGYVIQVLYRCTILKHPCEQ